jgi:hypothetical protein
MKIDFLMNIRLVTKRYYRNTGNSLDIINISYRTKSGNIGIQKRSFQIYAGIVSEIVNIRRVPHVKYVLGGK